MIRSVGQQADARVTVLGISPGPAGPAAEFVIGDSELERSAIAPSYPGGGHCGLQRAGHRRRSSASTACARGRPPFPASTAAEVRWVTVLSVDLSDVEESVAVDPPPDPDRGRDRDPDGARRPGWLASGAHSRRLRRLEAAAEAVAEGDFRTQIPVDSTDEVGQLARSFNEMQKRLARLDSARKEFIANASHELRTPIFSLGGFVELLEDEDPDPEARAEFVRTMRGQIDRLTKLTADLLDLSKLDADAIAMHRDRVHLGRLAERVASEFRPAAEQHESDLDGRPLRGGGRDGRPGQAGAGPPYPDRQRPHAHPEGNRDHHQLTAGQRNRLDRRPRRRARASTPTIATGSSSGSTPATSSAGRASGWRSRASSRCAWAATSQSSPTGDARSSRCGSQPAREAGA